MKENNNDKDSQIEQPIKMDNKKDTENEFSESLHEQSESKIEVNNLFEKNDEIPCPIKEKYTYDPYLESNLINRFFFYWAYKIIKMAKIYKLEITDLGKPAESNNAKTILNEIKRIWEDLGYKNYKNYALLRTILRANIYTLIIIMFLSILQAGLDYFSVKIIKQFIDHFNKNGNMEYSTNLVNIPLWALGGIFIGVQIILVLLNLNTQMIQINLGNKIGNQLNCFVYYKILNYPSSGFTNDVNEGEIINFIQFDSSHLFFLFTYSPNAFISPILIITYIYLLFEFFHFTFIFGLIVIVIFFILNYKISKEVKIRQNRMLEKKDLCMKVTTETFENIKILKIYNWENNFKRKIIQARKIEMDHCESRLNMINLIKCLNYLCPVLISIITIGVYNIFNDTFNISTMLIGLSIFSKLPTPIKMLQNLVLVFVESIVSFKRIEHFLKMPDIQRKIIHKGKYDKNAKYAIKISGGNFSWGLKQNNQHLKTKETISQKIIENENNNQTIIDSASNNKKEVLNNQEKEDYDITLKNISLEIKPNELVAIIGEVGSGKSSLLQAIINNLILINPKQCDGIHINGKIGFSAQLPWLSNDTIRNNIIFSKPFNEEKYKKVIDLCQLKEDLDTFEGKDLTEIGEKGVNLSGGQKARISIARLIYNEPDIYLFDEPIAAVDANVGQKIMENCIIKYLNGKTRIIVTNALNYLKYIDKIIYMKSGNIEWTGNYDELQNQSFYSKLMTKNDLNHHINDNQSDNNCDNQIKEKEDDKIVRITKEEEQSNKGIKFSVYLDYCRYMGGICFMIIVIIVMCLWQANKGGSDLWLAYWSKDENQEKCQTDKKYKWTFFLIFSGLGLFSVFFTMIRIILLTKGIIRLGIELHKDMIEKLIKAPINLFHDIIPRGQIYNRLSKDLDNINQSIWNIGDILISILSVITSFILCGIYDFFSLFYMPIVFIFGFYITSFFLGGSRPLTRMTSISLSPILNIINETLSGLTTIRAFEEENYYKEKYFERINNSLNINNISRGTNLWFQEQFKFLSILYLSLLIIKAILNEDILTAQSCSIMFTYGVLLQEHLGNIFYFCSNFEINMISMERCVNYTNLIQDKSSYIPKIDNKLMRQKWPQKGEISFKNYSVKYRPGSDIILKNINITIKSGEKVGVCGRTGSGKSTICLSLFRILEADEGQIIIDDIDISTIGLDLLRNCITIIPQDPCIIEGSLKSNLDPFNKNKDEEIIKILKDIGFDYMESDDKILNKKIEQDGSNLSVGQKQLICIARALLRKSKIIIMDEATSNIDINTEILIQNALNIILKNATVITVAHKIKTIINYDKILVLNDGEVKEFDSPSNLIKNKDSMFYKLYSKSI